MENIQGKASTRAKNKYRDKTYDRMELVLPKGKKDQIKAFLEPSGESVNAFVNRAIDEAMQHDLQNSTTTTVQGSPTTPLTFNQFILPLTPEELEQLDLHCLFSLCKKPDFIHEAIKEKLLRESPSPVPQKKESLAQKGKPMMIVRQTDDDDLTEEIPALLKTIRDGQKTSSKSTLTQMVAGQIITDKMNNLRSENRIEEYIALTNLFATTPKNKADFMEEVKNANFMRDVDETINALLIFHGLKDGE